MTDFAPPDEDLSPQIGRDPRGIVPLASTACAQVWGALAIAQGKFESPKRTKEATVKGTTRDGRPYEYKYKYAPLDEIERSVRGPLAENGLFRQQYLVSRGGQWFIRTIIGHGTGEWIASDYPVIASDSKNPAQAFASGVTYARRYGLSLALGICPEDDDDAQASAGDGEQLKPSRQAGKSETKARRQPIRESGAAAEYDPEPNSVPVSKPPEPYTHREEIADAALDKAREGRESLRSWYRSLSKANRTLLTEDQITELNETADAADAALAADRDESPEPANPSDGKASSAPQPDPQAAPAHDAQPAREPESELPALLQTASEGVERPDGQGVSLPQAEGAGGRETDVKPGNPVDPGVSLSPRLARIDEMLRTTAEGGLDVLNKLFKRQLPADQKSLAAFLPEYEAIARGAIAETP